MAEPADDDVIVEDDEAVFEEPGEEKTPDEKVDDTKTADDDSEAKDRRSAIAQKKHWREKAEKESQKVKTLETELSELRKAVKKPTDEAEAKAQEYIRTQARQVYEELQSVKQKEEADRLEKFEGEVEDILESNPDISETELLDAIEEFEVEPAVALKILKKQTDKAKKPKMPVAKRSASGESPPEKHDDSKKSMWDILKEETAKLKKS